MQSSAWALPDTAPSTVLRVSGPVRVDRVDLGGGRVGHEAVGGVIKRGSEQEAIDGDRGNLDYDIDVLGPDAASGILPISIAG
jgi:hypothetical protein